MVGINGDYFWEIVIIFDFWFIFIYRKVINLIKSFFNGFCVWRISYYFINEVFYYLFFFCLVVWGIVNIKIFVFSEN